MSEALLYPRAEQRRFSLARPLTVVVFAVLPVSEFLEPLLKAVWYGAVVLLLGGFLLRGRWVPPVLGSRWGVAAVLVILGTLATAGTSSDVMGHFVTGLTVAAFLGLGMLACRTLFTKNPALRGTAVKWFLIGQSASAAAAVLQILGSGLFGTKLEYGRAAGLSGHPNILGLMSGVAVVLAAYLMARRQRGSLPVVGAAALSSVGLLASGSISALIATGVGIVILGYTLRVRISRVLGLLALAGVVVWGFMQIAPDEDVSGTVERIEQVTGQTDKVSTWDIRTQANSDALERITASPLSGEGLAQDDGLLASPDNGGYVLVHNLPIRAWYQGGPLLFAGIAVLYAAALWLPVHSRRTRWNGASAGVLAVALSFALTSAALSQMYFWVILCAAWAMVERPPQLRRDPAVGARDRLPHVERRLERRPRPAIGAQRP